MKITVYTITDCKFSQEEKEYLKGLNLPFEEKNLEQNKDWLTEMLTVSNNFAGTPVTVIEKDDGTKVVLKGFTKDEFEKELNVKAPAAGTGTTPAEAGMADAAQTAAATTPAADKPAEAAAPAAAAPEPTAAAGTPPEPVPPGGAPSTPEPTMPEMPPMPEPTAPELPQTPAVNDTPAPAPVNVPDLSTGISVGAEPAAAPPAEPPMPPAPSMPEPATAATAPAAAEPAVVATGAPASGAAPVAAAPQVNDDALNAILNNLQAKVSDPPTAGAPPAPKS